MVRKIIATFIFIFALLFAFLFFLFNGIKLKSFSFGEIYISQLYIKLDKKLIVDIEKIKLSTNSKVESSFEDMKTNIAKIPTALKFFERIDIEELYINGNTFKILLDKDHLYLDNKFINVSSKYKTAANSVTLELYSLYLKDLDLLLEGKIKLDYFKEIVNFFGTYMYKKEIEGEINSQFRKETIDFFVNTKQVKNIKFLKDFFRLDKIAESWMYDNVTGDMKLNYLYGKLKTDTFEPILDSIEGDATISNADIFFNKKVAAVKTPKLQLHYKNDTLSFDLEKPTYKQMSIEGSRVAIYNLTSAENGYVDVRVKHQGVLNDVILAILDAYDIPLPIKQVDGTTDASIFLKIPYNSPMETYGDFESKNANFMIDSFPFYSKHAKVELRNKDVIIKQSHFKHKEMLDSTIDLLIDTKSLEAIGKAHINSFEIKTKMDEIVKLENVKTPISLNFKGNTAINIEKLKTKIVLLPKTTNVYVKELEIVYPYSKLLQEIDVKHGSVNLAIVDENSITFNTKLRELDLPIKRQGEDLTTLEFDGIIEGEKVHLVSKEKDISIDVDKEVLITLNALDVYETKEEKKRETEDLNVRLLDSNLHIRGNIFYARDVSAELSNDLITFNGTFDRLDIPVSSRNEKLRHLEVEGKVDKGRVSISTQDGLLNFYMPDEKSIQLSLKNLDLHYDTDDKIGSIENLSVNGENSKIIMNDKFHVLANKYNFVTNSSGTRFDLVHNKTTMNYAKDLTGKITITANDISDTFINQFFQKEFVKGGTLDVNAVGEGGVVRGKMVFHDNKLTNLAVLNNVITLVNTTPALINPLLAVPAIFGMVTSDGFNLNGYKVVEGYVDFAYSFDNKYLNMYRIATTGSSVDFEGFATMDFENNIVNSDMNLVFMKDYSKIVGAIPGISYIFLGEDKKVATKVNITGKIDNPDIETNILKDSASAPVDILRRIITLPFRPFMSNGQSPMSEENLKKHEERVDDILKGN